MGCNVRVYIAGTFHDPRIEGGAIVREVQSLGHEVVSRWHNADVWQPESRQRTLAERCAIAMANYRDIDGCETMLVVPMDVHHLYDAHVEVGYALGTKKRVVILGAHDAMSSMTAHERVEYIATIAELGRVPEPEPLRCDKHGCDAPPTYECRCSRCDREPPDERFHSCDAHQHDAAVGHNRVRGYHASWCRMAGAAR